MSSSFSSSKYLINDNYTPNNIVVGKRIAMSYFLLYYKLAQNQEYIQTFILVFLRVRNTRAIAGWFWFEAFGKAEVNVLAGASVTLRLVRTRGHTAKSAQSHCCWTEASVCPWLMIFSKHGFHILARTTKSHAR